MAALALSVVLGAATTASAASPCANDIAKFCKGVKAGGGRVKACLDKNVDKLSDGCRKLRGDKAARHSAWAAACDGDVAKHCTGVESGKGRILTCLEKKHYALSDACKSVIDEDLEKRMITTGPCAGDIQKFCKGTAPGGGRIRACLKEQGRALSPVCGDRIGAKSSGGAAAAPAAPAGSWSVGDALQVEWKGSWFPASILEAKDGKYKIHYDNYDSSWDEWVGPERMKAK
ncbi:MAG: hypothetical protein AMXMBFR64_12320 [Myxococcales bacterium]